MTLARTPRGPGAQGVKKYPHERHRPDAVRTEYVGRRNAQRSGHGVGSGQRVRVRFAKCGEQWANAVVQRLTRLGRAHLARRALEQPGAQRRFQTFDRRAPARFVLANV